MSKPLGVRIFLSVVPSPTELKLARERLTRESCPRRYCWYWHTLAFNWEINPDQGCEVAERHIHRLILEQKEGKSLPPWQQCCRATGNPRHADYYEPREPYLKSDGWPKDFFQVVGKVARRRRCERRQQGKRRRGGEQDA
jgi:hypothetical protein